MARSSKTARSPVATPAPWIAPYDPIEQETVASRLAAPSAHHWLAQDEIGRDVLKRETDLGFLYAVIEPSLSSKEFFLRKAIGWALRSYAWTDPKEIARYVEKNRSRLSGLSIREALKNVARA